MKRKILSPRKILSLRKEGYCRCEAAIIAGRGILSLRSSDCSRASETEGEYLFARDVALIIKFPPWPLGYIHCVRCTKLVLREEPRKRRFLNRPESGVSVF